MAQLIDSYWLKCLLCLYMYVHTVATEDYIWLFCIYNLGVNCEWNDKRVCVCGFMCDKKGGETGQIAQVISELISKNVWGCLVKSEVLLIPQWGISLCRQLWTEQSIYQGMKCLYVYSLNFTVNVCYMWLQLHTHAAYKLQIEEYGISHPSTS